MRAGAAQGEVTAEFHLGRRHPAQAVLEEAGLPAKAVYEEVLRTGMKFRKR